MLYEAPAIHLLCTNLDLLNKVAKKLKKRALKKGGKNLFQSQIYTVTEYINETGLVNQNTFCTCLYLLGDVEDPNFTAALLKEIKPQDNDDTIYYCIRFLAIEETIRLSQYNDITFAIMKEL